ncbi:MAG: hypothetical protein JJLCMIEE_02992 [Acidimicrobiales bacterium]|nr:hypothetical protein [Acidimicrobiales bacterium]
MGTPATAEEPGMGHGNDLTVEFRPNAELPGPVAEAAAVRTAAGIRGIDPHSGKIDVSLKGQVPRRCL